MGRSLQFDEEPQSVSKSGIELLSARKQIHKDEGMSDRQTQNGEASSMRRGTWRNEKGMHLGFFFVVFFISFRFTKNIMISCLHPSQSDNPTKSTTHWALYIAIPIALTIFPMLKSHSL